MQLDIKKIKKTFVYQNDSTDCGPACLLSLLRYYGGNNSIDNLRELSGTNSQGTTLLGLHQAALKIGFTSKGYTSTIEAMTLQKEPIILHLIINNVMQHYVICYGFDGNKYLIGDPSKGIIYYTKEEIENLWTSKRLLTILPTNNIIKSSFQAKDKFRYFLSMLRNDFGMLFSSILTGIIVSMLGMTAAIYIQRLIDDIIPNNLTSKMWLGLILCFVILICRVFITAIRQYTLYKQCVDFNNRTLNKFINRIFSLPLSFFTNRKTGDFVARLNDTRRIQQVISGLVGTIIIDILIVITSLIVIAFYSKLEAIIISAILPIFYLIISKYNDSIAKTQKKVMENYANNENNYISTIQGIDTIKSFNKQEQFTNITKTIFNKYQISLFNLGKKNIKIGIISGILNNILLGASIGVGCYLIINQNLKIGELSAIFSIVSMMLQSIFNICMLPIIINEGKIAFNRIFDFSYSNKEVIEGEELMSDIDKIDVINVSFRFVGRQLILKSVSLNFVKGQLSVVTGECGCGKSTLVSILKRNYFPENGQILFNDVDYSKFSQISLNKNIAIMPQNIYVFDGTLYDNLVIGLPNNMLNINYVNGICIKYGFERYINKFPQSYGTIVGENGLCLSGGQKQIIGIIRLLLWNPQVLILDEPTSSMDSELANFTINLLNSIKKDKIVIIISHQLRLISKYVDQIYILENGLITHSGSHSDLITTNNFYSRNI